MAGRTGRTTPSRPPSRNGGSPGRLLQSALRRLDRAAGRLNPFLMLIAIGLAILNVSCFTALKLSHRPAMTPAEAADSVAFPVPPYGR